MAKARRRENAGGPWYRDRFSGLAQTRKVEVVDASVTDFATELALVVIAAAAPATAIAVADEQPALDRVAVALAVDARHQIGRESGRERGWKAVEILVGAGDVQ